MNKKKGFGLVEVVVAGVLVSLLAVGTMKIIEGMGNAGKIAGSQGETTLLKIQIQGLLSDPKVCKLALKNEALATAKFNPDAVLPANPTQSDINAFNLENSLAKIKLGDWIVAENLSVGYLNIKKIDLIELEKSLRTDLTINNTPAKRIVSALRVEAQVGQSGLTKTFSLPLYVITNNSNTSSKYQVMECNTPNKSEDNTPTNTSIIDYQTIDSDNSPNPQTVKFEITLAHSSIVMITGYTKGSYLGTVSNAGTNCIIKIDDVVCGSTFSFEALSNSISFSASASCIKKLEPGPHTLTAMDSTTYPMYQHFTRLSYAVFNAP